jgi:hypothetical protein
MYTQKQRSAGAWVVALCITFVSAFLIAFVPASHAFPPLGALHRFALALVGCGGPLALALAAAAAYL